MSEQSKAVHAHHKLLLEIAALTKADQQASPQARFVASVIESWCRLHPESGRDVLFTYLDGIATEIKDVKNTIRAQIR